MIAVQIPHDAATVIAAGDLDAEADIEVVLEGNVARSGTPQLLELGAAVVAELIVALGDLCWTLELGAA